MNRPTATQLAERLEQGDGRWPRTAELALRIEHSEWSSESKRVNLEKCVATVESKPWWTREYGGSDGPMFDQCRRRPGHGPGALYCRSHAERCDPR